MCFKSLFVCMYTVLCFYYIIYLCTIITLGLCFFFFFKQKTAYEMRISDWSSDVCSSDLFRAWSAGSQPRGEVHPMALSVLNGLGFDTAGMRSKSWDEFAVPDAPQFDFIFTVCDNAAGETCPVWIGHPMTDRKSTRLNSSH